MTTAAIHYRITAADPYAHLFQIELTIAQPDPAGQKLRLPAWIPGSYMIRDFARNIVTIRAHNAAGDVALHKLDKSTWQLAPGTGAVTVCYRVYAWDLSVRAAHLDQRHAYFNGTSVFLEVLGQSGQPCTVDIEKPTLPEAQHWRVATSLQEFGTPRYGFGRYRAENYDDLIDHPVEIADFSLVSFTACGVPHDFVLSGIHNADLERIARDLQQICEYQIRLFGEPAPFSRYVFITWVVGDGYGGLEHRASTSLICSRDDLPLAKQGDAMSEGYKTFLGLCSHEYFHSWNVKRIQPAIPYDLRQENPTPLLWAFEGITSYYDDLTLVRCGLISIKEYLELQAKNVTRVLRNPGRLTQSVAESSFDAWTKFYKQDENSVNAIVSYYTKGGLVAMTLDLTLRRLTQHTVTLDDVMRCLWQEFALQQKPVAEFDILQIAVQLLEAQAVDTNGIARFREIFQHAVYGTQDLPLDEALRSVGVEYNLRAATSLNDGGGAPAKADPTRPDMGIGISAGNGGVQAARVLNNGPAHRAGISAGDVLIAINQLKVDQGSFEKVLNRFQPGDSIRVHGFRRDELMEFNVTLAAPAADTCYFTLVDESLCQRWLRDQ
jgi:predicted metalloprotease with PDZ domain